MDLCDADDLTQQHGPIRVYLAARYSRKMEVREIAKMVAAAGAELCTDWFNEPDDPNIDLPALSDTRAEHIAERDVDDMRRASICISLTENPLESYKRGGRHVEFGFCLALGIPLWNVGPRETIYHYLPWVEHFGDINEMIEALKREVASCLAS